MDANDEWRGWRMVVDEQGGMFFYHEKLSCSQWEQPDEL